MLLTLFLILQLLLCSHTIPLNSDLSAKALVNTYYDTNDKKLYLVNSDGTKGSEIKMGGSNGLSFNIKSSTVGVIVDISNYANSDKISMSAWYPANANTAQNFVNTISQAKQWNNEEFDIGSNVKFHATYSNGKITFMGNGAQNIAVNLTFA